MQLEVLEVWKRTPFSEREVRREYMKNTMNRKIVHIQVDILIQTLKQIPLLPAPTDNREILERVSEWEEATELCS